MGRCWLLRVLPIFMLFFGGDAIPTWEDYSQRCAMTGKPKFAHAVASVVGRGRLSSLASSSDLGIFRDVLLFGSQHSSGLASAVQMIWSAPLRQPSWWVTAGDLQEHLVAAMHVPGSQRGHRTWLLDQVAVHLLVARTAADISFHVARGGPFPRWLRRIALYMDSALFNGIVDGNFLVRRLLQHAVSGQGVLGAGLV